MNQMSRITLRSKVILVALVAAESLHAATSITLQERVAARSSVVRLSDVATVGTADRAMARQLAAIPLLPAPAPGTERYLLKREVADLLEANGVNLKEIEFVGADRIAISAEGSSSGIRESSEDMESSTSEFGVAADAKPRYSTTPLNRHALLLADPAGANSQTKLDDARANELRGEYCRIIADYVDAKMGQPGSCRVACTVDERYLPLLAAKTSQPVCGGGSEPWTGRQRFVVSFTTTQGKVQLPIYAQVAAKAVPVVVAGRPIARGDVITASQIELRPVENVPRPTDRRAACDSIEKILGMQARQAIPAGEVVFSDQLEQQTLVKRNVIVTVSSQSGRIRVRTTAKARQDGARGDLIQVESLDTHERYDVRVTGPRDTAVCVVAETGPDPPTKHFQAIRPAARAF
jgi:flagella basal body P-ring formation protein FlgA